MKNDFPLYNNNKTSLRGQDFEISQFLCIYINQTINKLFVENIFGGANLIEIARYSLAHICF